MIFEMKSIGIGVSDFEELIEGNYYFVDKSLLIRDVIKDGGKVLLLPRPRRFGKTLNMSMLKNFFDIKENTRHLFERISNRTRD